MMRLNAGGPRPSHDYNRVVRHIVEASKDSVDERFSPGLQRLRRRDAAALQDIATDIYIEESFL